jgi:hypothetical protein
MMRSGRVAVVSRSRRMPVGGALVVGLLAGWMLVAAVAAASAATLSSSHQTVRAGSEVQVRAINHDGSAAAGSADVPAAAPVGEVAGSQSRVARARRGRGRSLALLSAVLLGSAVLLAGARKWSLRPAFDPSMVLDHLPDAHGPPVGSGFPAAVAGRDLSLCGDAFGSTTHHCDRAAAPHWAGTSRVQMSADARGTRAVTDLGQHCRSQHPSYPTLAPGTRNHQAMRMAVSSRASMRTPVAGAIHQQLNRARGLSSRGEG